MLHLALIFWIISMIASVLGVYGVAFGAAQIAWILMGRTGSPF